jgi:hypothetical protein
VVPSEVVIERDPGLEVVKLASNAVTRRQGSRSNTMGNIHGTIIMGIYDICLCMYMYMCVYIYIDSIDIDLDTLIDLDS